MIARAIVAGLLFVPLAASAAGLHKCEVSGKPTIYTDQPCPPGAREAPTEIVTEAERAELARQTKMQADRERAAAKSKAAAEMRARQNKALDEVRSMSPQPPSPPSPPSPEQLEQRCAAAIREKMAYLEPTGPYSHLGQGYLKEHTRLRVMVRLSDSFRAAPVGVVECTVSGSTGYTSVVKIRQ